MKIIVTGGAGFIGGNFVHHMVYKISAGFIGGTFVHQMVKKNPDYQIVNLDLLN